MAGTRTRPRGSPGQHAPLGEQTLPLTACFRFITGRVVEYGCPINTLKNGVPTPCTNTHTHTHMEELMSQVLRSNTHTHTHTQKGEAGRGDAEERPKYDKGRRGRVESNHTSRGRPLPAQNHTEVETRERERQHARLWASKCCRSPLVAVLSPASSSNTESPIASIPNQDHKRTTTLTLL